METNRWPDRSHGLVLALLFCATAGWTWAAWAKLGTGFGSSLHRAELLAGGVTPVASLTLPESPLGPLVLATLLSLFGSHLDVAYLAGLSILLAQSIVLWRIARHFSSALEASLGVIGFWFLFAFGTGASNWITPGSFGAPLSLLLGTLALDLLLHGGGQPSRHTLVTAGEGIANGPTATPYAGQPSRHTLVTAGEGIANGPTATPYAGQPSRRTLITAGCCIGASLLAHFAYGVAATLAALLLIGIHPRISATNQDGKPFGSILPWIVGPAFCMVVGTALLPATSVLVENLLPPATDGASQWALKEALRPAWSNGTTFGMAQSLVAALACCLIVLPLFAAASLPGVRALQADPAEKAGALFLLLAPAIGIAFASPWIGPGGESTLDWVPLVWVGVALVALVKRDRLAPSPSWQVLAVIGLYTFVAHFGRELPDGGPDHAGVFTAALVVFLVGTSFRRLLPDSVQGEHAAAFTLLVWIAAGAAPHVAEYHARNFAVNRDRGTLRMTRLEARPLLRTLDRIQAVGPAETAVLVLPDTQMINFLSGTLNPLRSFGIGAGWPVTAGEEVDFVRSLARQDVAFVILRKDALGPDFRATLSPAGRKAAALLAMRFELQFETRHHLLFSPRGRAPTAPEKKGEP